MDIQEIKKALAILNEAKANNLHCFEIIGVENGHTFKAFEVLPRITHECSEYEFTYALLEREKEVLNLRIGESMYFQPTRDDKTSRAIIVRVA